GKSGQYTYTWDYASCRYKKSGACTCTPTNDGKSSYTENCTGGKVGVITYTWDTDKCSYTKTDTCSCKNGARADGTCKQPVYKYRLETQGSPTEIPACPKSSSGCSAMTKAHCASFRTPNGNPITYPASYSKCSEISCSEAKDVGVWCSTATSVTEDNNYYNCVYTNSVCKEYIATYQ
ncbi:MAG: hypothetical protein IKC13_06345, partial [Elusimicrobiaceae bacterium]|nr:hypothetical protein [Elusimicrobiaceae bacterium]